MSGPDLLFSVRNHFYLGAYNAAINEASDLYELSELEQTERDCYVQRAYCALGSYELVLSEIPEDAGMSLQAVKLFAEYMSDKTKKDEVLKSFAEWMEDPVCSSNPTVCLLAGQFYAQEGNYVEALKAVHTGTTLEMRAFTVDCLLKMHRVDQAEKQVKEMSAIDDDHTLTQLATAWVGLALGGAKVQEAHYVFQELGDKFNWSAMLHSGAAVANMKMGQWEDAERELLDAFNKDAKDPDMLANLVCVGLHLGKNTQRYASQLKMLAPTHPASLRLAAAEESFERAAASFA